MYCIIDTLWWGIEYLLLHTYCMCTYVCTLLTVEEWRLKWGITAEFRDVSKDQVMEYLHYPSDGVRLNALYHCARSAIAIFTASRKSAKKEGHLESLGSEVFSPLLVFLPHLERCLSDSNLCMRVASTVLLTTLGRWSHEVQISCVQPGVLCDHTRTYVGAYIGISRKGCIVVSAELVLLYYTYVHWTVYCYACTV